MTDLRHYRELLNVTKDASKAEIKKAYRALAKQWHPDNFYQDPDKHKIAEHKFKEITIAYDFLINNTATENTTASTKNSNSSTTIKTEKTDPVTYYRLGVFLAKRGDREESLDFFGKAIKLHPEYLEALEYRYQVLSELGFEYRAAADRRKIREIQAQTKSQTSQSSAQSPSSSTPKSTNGQTPASSSPQDLQSPSPPKTRKIQAQLLKRFVCRKSVIRNMVVDRRRRLITISNEPTIQIFQLGRYKLSDRLKLYPKAPVSLDLHPVLQNSMVTVGQDGIVQIFDLEKNKRIFAFKQGLFSQKIPDIKRAYFLKEADCLLLLTADHTLKKWDFRQQKYLYEKPSAIAFPEIALNKHRTRIALMDKRQTFFIRETSTGKLIHSFKFKAKVTALSLSTNGKILAIATLKNCIEIFDIDRNERITQLQGYAESIRFLCFIKNNNYLLTLGGAGAIKIWSLRSCKNPFVLMTDREPITSYTLIDKERTLILGTRKGEVLMYRLPQLP